ncbi:MAG TPA: D-alanine--D-alanine ligase [Phycisphaerae bacterium]|nr:D-alanine--D-alanine ligase [Phycisphaerae bacterium]
MDSSFIQGTTLTESGSLGRRRPIRVPAVRNGRPSAGATGQLDVTVLMGGPSDEREVSMMSGRAIADALKRLGHHVTPADIAPDNLAALESPGIDVVFIALHGAFGESGEVQDLCRQRGLRYTGSGPEASRLAMDKAVCKQICRRAGLITPDWVVVAESHSRRQRERLLSSVPPPVVVKPVDGGSSLDVVIARDDRTCEQAMAEQLGRYGRVLVERYVQGRELTVGVLGDNVLPVLEIVPAVEFYDYYAKYADDSGTRYVFDHGLADSMVRDVRADAWKCFRALGCRDLGRVDFIMDATGRAWLLEINTIPGFTGHSLLPMAAEKVGMSFDQMVQALVEMALER